MPQDCVAAPELELRPASGDDAALTQLLDVHFDGRSGLLREFPLLLGADNRMRCLVLCDASGSYRAHAAWRPFELITSRGPLRAAGIGMVTTHGAWRGRGLASRLVERCVAAALLEDCDVALLFGAVRGLYARLGFVPAGRERWSCIASPAPPGGICPGVRAGEGRDAPRLLELLRTQPLRVERSLPELRRLLEIPDLRLQVLERGAEVVAYAIEGKGRDLQGVVHEWAGPAGDVALLLRSLAARASVPLWMVSPASLSAPLGGESVRDERIGPLAQLRILRPERCGGRDPVQVFGSGPCAGEREVYIWGLDSI